MRSLAVLLASIVLVGAPTPASAGAPTAPRRRALVIGIDRYAPSARWQDLDGAVNDARDMAEMLQSRFGYRPEDVTLLLDGEATREAILAGFRRLLIDSAAPGDLGVLYYAGHGSQVKNLKSTEPDHLDETIVPTDGRDIRDVELGRLAEAAADRGLRLTIVLDSCHSGSATRGIAPTGKVRAAAPDLDHPVSDGEPRPAPDRKGVLILSAARAEQLAGEARRDGRPHGAFTAALLDTLSGSSNDASAEAVLIRSHALVKAIRPGQDPAMEGTEERRRAPLFTPPTRGGSGRPVVAVAGVKGEKIELLGGAAMGLSEGATLVRQGTVKPPVRLTVQSVASLSRSVAGVAGAKDGDRTTVATGDLFEVERYALVGPSPLRVEIGETWPMAKVAALAKALAPLGKSTAIHLVTDPTVLDPTHVLSWRGGRWELRGPKGSVEALEGEPDARALEKSLAGKGIAGAGKPCERSACLFVRLPVADEVARGLAWQESRTAPVVATTNLPDADYLLTGRPGAAGPQYALVKSGVRASSDACSTDFQLPVRSAWVTATTKGAADAAKELDELALRIGRVNAWLTLRAPQDDASYPWRLEVTSGGKPIVGASVKPNAEIALALVRSGPGGAQRFPYVFAIDCKGAIDVAWPEQGRAAELLPVPTPGAAADRTPLTNVQIDDTRGRYTFLLVVADEQLPSVASVVQEGVWRGEAGEMTRGLAPTLGLSRGGAGGDELATALFSLGRTRGLRFLPRNWTVQRVGFVAGP